MHHVFVYVVRSTQDHFSGLRQRVVASGDTTYDIFLDANEYDVVDRVEYGGLRLLRPWYYRRIFRNLERRLDDAIGAQAGPIVCYFSDEGVWSVFFAQYRRRRANPNVRAVDVQHGFYALQPIRMRGLRRLVNRVATVLTGYPAIGYGSAGGAGRDPFDLYLTYDETTAALAAERTGRPAIPAPRLIKHDLISNFFRLTEKDHSALRKDLRVLFAMNIPIAGSPVLCSSEETWDSILALAEYVMGQGAHFVVRLHPGMNHAFESERFAQHPIARVAALDPEPNLHVSMAQSAIVMSFISTTLWEADLLGLQAVQVNCKCCKPVELGFKRAILDLEGDWRPLLTKLLRQAGSDSEFDWRMAEGQEWSRIAPLLLGFATDL